MNGNSSLRSIIAAVIVLFGVGLTLTVVIDNGNGHQKSITVHVDGADKDHALDDTITAPKATVEKQKGTAEETLPDLHQRKETLSQSKKTQIEHQAEKGTTGSDRVPPIPTGASFSQAGCRTYPVHNYSGRGGVRPGLGVAHYWASWANAHNWGPVLGIASLFNNPRYQASSNYIIDHQGRCLYIIPETAKAWTQGNMNSFSACSIEMEGDADHNGYTGAGLHKAGLVFRDCFRRWGIPRRVGHTYGRCSIALTGLVDHDELGCGNNHTDIQPFATHSPFVLRQLVRAMGGSAGNPSHLSRAEHKVIRSVSHPKGTGHSRRYWCGRLHRHNAALYRDGKRHGWRHSHRGLRFQAGHKAARKHC